MEFPHPGRMILLLLFLILVFLLLVAVVALVALRDAPLAVNRKTELRRECLSILGAWFLATLFFSWDGFFEPVPGGLIPVAVYWLVVPILLFAVLIKWNKEFRKWAESVPLSLAALAQAPRVWGLLFLELAFQRQLPWVFAFPAGLGDFLIGASSVWVALDYFRNQPGRKILLRLWNWLGLMDLGLASLLGLLAAPGPFRFFQTGPSTGMLGAFPWAVIPVFMVPLGLILHYLSLRRLRRES
jgi:Ca2+/Na+ antiporter